MKDPLHDFVIATIGDAGSGISAAKLKRFIEANGGRYVSSVSEDTTHLLCSQEHWTAQIGEVSSARALKAIKVVSYDWLEDCLQNRARKREGPYLFERPRKRRKTEVIENQRETFTGSPEEHTATTDEGDKESSAAEGMSIKSNTDTTLNSASPSQSQDASKSSEDSSVDYSQSTNEKEDPNFPPNLDGCKIYCDTAGLLYNVKLRRIDKQSNLKELYVLRLYESVTTPHTYTTHIGYTDAKGENFLYALNPIGSPFSEALLMFRRIFHGKTCIHWDDRSSSAKQSSQLSCAIKMPQTYFDEVNRKLREEPLSLSVRHFPFRYEIQYTERRTHSLSSARFEENPQNKVRGVGTEGSPLDLTDG